MARALSILLASEHTSALVEISWWRLLTGEVQIGGDGDAREEVIHFSKEQGQESVPEQIDEADLGFKVPSGWTGCQLGDLTSLITSGSRGWKRYYAESGASFIRSQDIKLDRLSFDDRAFVRLPGEVEGARTRVQVGDLLLTITGANVGKCAAIVDDPGEAYVSQHVALIRPLVPGWTMFLHAWLTAPLGGRGRLEEVQYGLKPGLNLTQLRQLPCPLPPLSAQAPLVALGTRIEEASAEVQEARAHTEETRTIARASCLQALVEKGEWDRVRDNWDSLFTTPESVDDLRRTILDLAVRGRLVEQSEEEGTGKDFLAQAAAERDALIAEGTIRRRRVAPVDESDTPFDLPLSWAWARWHDVAHDWGQGKPEAEFTYVDVSAIDNRAGRVSGEVAVLGPDEAPSRARKKVRRGTVIYSTVRPYLLNVAVIESDYTPSPVVSTAFSVLHPYCSAPARYLLHYLRSPPFTAYVESRQKGVAYPAINDGDFQAGMVPVPPIAEQHRIVAKVDELMALCDELEARLRDVQEISEQLAESVVHRVGITHTAHDDRSQPL